MQLLAFRFEIRDKLTEKLAQHVFILTNSMQAQISYYCNEKLQVEQELVASIA